MEAILIVILGWLSVQGAVKYIVSPSLPSMQLAPPPSYKAWMMLLTSQHAVFVSVFVLVFVSVFV